MASVIALAGSPVKMASNALYMIHNVSGGAHGDADDLRKTADLLDKVQTTMVDAYKKKTKMARAKIEEMMAEETWMTAKEAMELGFVDEITSDVKMAAMFDLSKFRNAPRFDTTTKPNAMTIETPEFLALQAEHKTTCEQAVALKSDFEAKVAEVTALSAKLSEAQTKLKDADTAITSLKASMEKTAAEHAAALSDFDAKVAAKAATMLAQTGTTPVVIGSPAAPEPNAIMTQFEAIKDPAERVRFYRANKAAIDATFRK